MQQDWVWVAWVINGLVLLAALLLTARNQVNALLMRLMNSGKPELKQLPFYSAYYFHRKSQLALLPKNNYIMFLGDSLTAEGEWAELLGIPVSNRGLSGDTTYGILQRLDVILTCNPPKLFLMIGTNDIERRLELSVLLKNYQNILQQCCKALPDTVIYVQSILPVADRPDYPNKNQAIAIANQHIATLAQEFGYPFLNVHPHFVRADGSSRHQELDPQYSQDGVHLNGAGYQQWCNLIREYVEA